jgi:hypothetical protein
MSRGADAGIINAPCKYGARRGSLCRLIVARNHNGAAETAATSTGGNPWNERHIPIKEGDALSAILRDLGATREEINAIASALGTRAQDGNLHAGQELRVLMSPVRAAQRLQPVRIMLISDQNVEAVVALSDQGRYVNVDVRPFSEGVLPRSERGNVSGKSDRLTASRVPELETPGLEKHAALPASPRPTESARPKPIVIAGDNGGVLRIYYERYRAEVAAGATFRIDGRCRSACTLVLAWADRVCVTERAALGFHGVRDMSGQRVPSGNDLLMSLYPAPVREYISAHGGLPPAWGTMWVSGPALRSLVKPCE